MTKTERMTRWNEAEADFDKLMDDKEILFGQFFAAVRSLFFAKAETYNGTRKPPINLRLLAANPQYRVCISPSSWDYTHHKIGSAPLIEIMYTEPIDRGQRMLRALSARVTNNTPTLQGVYFDHLVDATEVMVGVFVDFMTDPQTVIARDKNHCAICGRKLTDGTSRARGFGPECVRYLPYLLFLCDSPVICESRNEEQATRRAAAST